MIKLYGISILSQNNTSLSFYISPISTPWIFNWISRDTLGTHGVPNPGSRFSRTEPNSGFGFPGTEPNSGSGFLGTEPETDIPSHHICRGEIRPNNDNVRGLLETPTPTTPKEIFRFLKGAEYYRKFIPNFSRIASPLHKYNPSNSTHPSHTKPTIFTLSAEEHAAFEQIKYILTTDLVVRLPNNQLPFKIQTDASQLGIDAVLLQTYPEGDRPMCYISKKLTPAQQRWSPIEQECYAIVKAVELWHHYSHGHHFILESDHKPLEALMRRSQMNDKCEPWRLRLQSYDFTVKHVKGK